MKILAVGFFTVLIGGLWGFVCYTFAQYVSDAIPLGEWHKLLSIAVHISVWYFVGIGGVLFILGCGAMAAVYVNERG